MNNEVLKIEEKTLQNLKKKEEFKKTIEEVYPSLVVDSAIALQKGATLLKDTIKELNEITQQKKEIPYQLKDQVLICTKLMRGMREFLECNSILKTLKDIDENLATDKDIHVAILTASYLTQEEKVQLFEDINNKNK